MPQASHKLMKLHLAQQLPPATVLLLPATVLHLAMLLPPSMVLHLVTLLLQPPEQLVERLLQPPDTMLATQWRPCPETPAVHLSMPAQLPCNHLLWLSLEWRALRLVQPCLSALSPALALRCSLSPVL